VEEQVQKEQEKLQCQLVETKLEPWAQKERERERERFLENETFNKDEDCCFPTSKPLKPDQPLNVMAAPPSK
jgi:translation initiation factor 4B